jgi:putative transposase
VGIARFATLSDGTVIEPLNSFKKHQARLKRYQRRMARKVKFSNNWKKAKAKVAKVTSTIANARRDFLHKASTTISKNHAVVCIEDLQVRNMSKSAAGTIEKPGRNVGAKSGLNRAILDQGWSAFRVTAWVAAFKRQTSFYRFQFLKMCALLHTLIWHVPNKRFA